MPATEMGNTITLRVPVLLELKSEVVVKLGDRIREGDVLARTTVDYTTSLHAAEYLGVKGGELKKYLLKMVGDEVADDEVLAKRKSLGNDKELVLKKGGRIQEITQDGEVVLVTGSEVHEIFSPVTGTVAEIDEGKVMIEISAYEKDLASGMGAPNGGSLYLLPMSDGLVDLSLVTYKVQGKIVGVDGMVTKALWYKLLTLDCAGVVCREIASNYEEWLQPHSRVPIGVVASEDSSDTWAKLEAKYCFIWPEKNQLICEK